MVRRGLFPRVGIRQAAALAAAQPGKARPAGECFRTLRHGGGDSVRDYRSQAGEAQHLRHGPQVDVEPEVGWAAIPGFSLRCGPAAGWDPRKAGGRVSHLRRPGRPSCAGMGGEDGLAGGHSDSRGRLRCPLGCDRRGVQAGRCGQRGGDFDLHHRHAAEDHVDPGGLRGGPGQRASWLYRDRGGALGYRRHFRSDCAARQCQGRGAEPWAWKAIARDRPACCG